MRAYTPPTDLSLTTYCTTVTGATLWNCEVATVKSKPCTLPIVFGREMRVNCSVAKPARIAVSVDKGIVIWPADAGVAHSTP